MVLLGVRRILQEGGHVESEIFFFFNETETHEKMAYLASEAQFTYWGALSFSLLLLNPYPLPQ